MAVLSDRQFYIVGAISLVGVGLIYFAGKKAVDTAGGLVTGNNALTEGTPYEGYGILGTLGAAANEASGGYLEKLGSGLGSKLYDWLNPSDAGVVDRDTIVLNQNNEGINE